MKKDTIEIKGILAYREGDYLVVQAWMPDGKYREVIREPLDGPFSHCVHACGIRKGQIGVKEKP